MSEEKKKRQVHRRTYKELYHDYKDMYDKLCQKYHNQIINLNLKVTNLAEDNKKMQRDIINKTLEEYADTIYGELYKADNKTIIEKDRRIGYLKDRCQSLEKYNAELKHNIWSMTNEKEKHTCWQDERFDQISMMYIRINSLQAENKALYEQIRMMQYNNSRNKQKEPVEEK